MSAQTRDAKKIAWIIYRRHLSINFVSSLKEIAEQYSVDCSVFEAIVRMELYFRPFHMRVLEKIVFSFFRRFGIKRVMSIGPAQVQINSLEKNLQINDDFLLRRAAGVLRSIETTDVVEIGIKYNGSLFYGLILGELRLIMAENSNMLNRERLQEIVTAFRSKIEPCWNEESAYKVPEISHYGSNISGGQCAVTCLVLMDILRKEFLTEQIFLVSGQVQSTKSDVVIRDHGWLQVGSGENALIIDPTADQAETIDVKVVVGTEKELEERGLRYIGKEIEEGYGEIEHPKRFNRYQTLKKAWNANQ